MVVGKSMLSPIRNEVAKSGHCMKQTGLILPGLSRAHP
jgi:hypothetical protein